MRFKILVLAILALLCSSSFGQDNKLLIPYLITTPVIDGIPDRDMSAVGWRNFAAVKKTDRKNKNYGVHYKIGYTYSGLYLLVRTDCSAITIRDRAYQNGDGFHLIVAKPNNEMPTDEFYVLAFAPDDKKSIQPSTKATWYYNIGLLFKPLSKSTKIECKVIDGKCYFELALSWDDIYPYHPLFSDSVGLNLCFVKAVGDNQKNYYYIKYDKKTQQEQSKRDYRNVTFEQPLGMVKPSTFMHLSKRNVVMGDSLNMKFVTYSPDKRVCKYTIDICSADNFAYLSTRQSLQMKKGVNESNVNLSSNDFSIGGYKAVWRTSDGSSGEVPFTILPDINEGEERSNLEKLRGSISEGDYSTMLFMLNSILNGYFNLKEYETAGKVREDYQSYRSKLKILQKDSLLSVGETAISRRAFLSRIDSSLQPYTIKLPDNYNRTKKYPLLVFLHGSGSTDEGMLNGRLTNGKFIEIAPFGRGTSNCFTTSGAEIDIKEAIDDAIKNFSVDTTRIVISGFSMGGYGAYRIYYEYPSLFKGVAVFAGHPNLANEWEGEGYPDFMRPEYLQSLIKKPLFVYHSKSDLNCPFDLTRKTVEVVKKLGGNVEFIQTEETGHGVPEGNSLVLFHKWLEKYIGVY